MLVMKLSEVAGVCICVPRHERISLDVPCSKEEGIWDTLGYYDGKIVTICDKAIQKSLKKKFDKDVELREKLEKLSKSREELILILRELVRLHEHSHAFLHTATVRKSKPSGKWYSNLPKEVNGPLTEFITYSVINSLKDEAKKLFVTVFLEFDKYVPKPYRNWREIKKS